MVEMEMTMDPIDSYLAEIGYIPQMTPAGRTIMVNPAAYPLSDEFLANEDAYIELTDAQQMQLDEDLDY
jgi:hypothetical protein